MPSAPASQILRSGLLASQLAGTTPKAKFNVYTMINPEAPVWLHRPFCYSKRACGREANLIHTPDHGQGRF